MTERWCEVAARTWFAVRAILVLIVVAGLAVDAYVHFDLASSYAGVKSSALSQGDLFRVEAVAAVVAALGLVVRPRRLTALFAFLVAAGGVAAVVVYRYIDVGSLGPLPNMYEPFWYAEKTQSACAEGAAALAAAVLVIAMHIHAHQRTNQPHKRSDNPIHLDW
jgi:hypothetical protein